jgi:hypothetical protein
VQFWSLYECWQTIKTKCSTHPEESDPYNLLFSLQKRDLFISVKFNIGKLFVVIEIANLSNYMLLRVIKKQE